MSKSTSITAEIDLDDSKFQAGIRRTMAGVKDLNSRMAPVTASLATFTGGFLSIQSAMALASKSLETFGDIADKASVTGFSPEFLQKLSGAAKLSGGSIDTLTGAILKFQNQVGGGTAKAIEELGINFGELRKLSPEDQFTRITDALEKMDDPVKRNALAIGIFGKSAKDVIAALGDLKNSNWQKFLSAEEIKNVAALGDAMDRLEMNAVAAAGALFAKINPAIEAMGKALKVAGEAGDIMVDILGTIGNSVAPGFGLGTGIRVGKAWGPGGGGTGGSAGSSADTPEKKAARMFDAADGGDGSPTKGAAGRTAPTAPGVFDMMRLRIAAHLKAGQTDKARAASNELTKNIARERFGSAIRGGGSAGVSSRESQPAQSAADFMGGIGGLGLKSYEALRQDKWGRFSGGGPDSVLRGPSTLHAGVCKRAETREEFRERMAPKAKDNDGGKSADPGIVRIVKVLEDWNKGGTN